MEEISPDKLSERLRNDDDSPLVLDIRHEDEFDASLDEYDADLVGVDLGRDREAFVRELASDIPNHPPNFERVKRTNVGRDSVPADELAELELGPHNCAAE